MRKLVLHPLIIACAFSFFFLQACAPKHKSEEPCHFVQNSFGERVSWNQDLPVKIYIHQSVPAKFYGAIENAMKQWEVSMGEQPVFQLMGVTNQGVKSEQDGHSIIYWRDQWDGAAVGEQARTTVFWKGKQIFEADIQVNAQDFEFFWEDTPINGAVDVESLILHELGHVLGLSHSSGSGSVMATRLASATLRRLPSKVDTESLSCEY